MLAMSAMTTACSGGVLGQPVLGAATIDGHRWWARVRQFRSCAYVEAWDESGFDGEAVIQTPDVRRLMDEVLRAEADGPAVLIRAARTFAAAWSAPCPAALECVDPQRWITPPRTGTIAPPTGSRDPSMPAEDSRLTARVSSGF